MDNISCHFEIDNVKHSLDIVYVEGTGNGTFLFGEDGRKHKISIESFYMLATPVTQALWEFVMGSKQNNSRFKGGELPVEHVSWYDINNNGGFLDRINDGVILKQLSKQLRADTSPTFCLPTETEWEYAARGGRLDADYFLFSGSDNPYEVAWYRSNSDGHTWPVGQKAPNQLGIYDMCGNVWEWCRDNHTYDTELIPRDGSPFLGDSRARILRGGCHHNYAAHCMVSKRYEIEPSAADECIGFRLVLKIK